ncbi:hypothetical protein HC928_03205 [bacterium]|nr:hypothetical protein [bacterium]
MARQLDSERAAPSIRYVPTWRDKHELYTFLVTTTALTGAGRDWTHDIVSAQQQIGREHTEHRLLAGGTPYRMTYLSSYELIGVLETGALPELDRLFTSYHAYPRGGALPVAIQEKIAARYEQRDIRRKQPLHAGLVDSFYELQRLELFALSLLTNAVRLRHDQKWLLKTLTAMGAILL